MRFYDIFSERRRDRGGRGALKSSTPVGREIAAAAAAWCRTSSRPGFISQKNCLQIRFRESEETSWNRIKSKAKQQNFDGIGDEGRTHTHTHTHLFVAGCVEYAKFGNTIYYVHAKTVPGKVKSNICHFKRSQTIWKVTIAISLLFLSSHPFQHFSLSLVEIRIKTVL